MNLGIIAAAESKFRNLEIESRVVFFLKIKAYL